MKRFRRGDDAWWRLVMAIGIVFASIWQMSAVDVMADYLGPRDIDELSSAAADVRIFYGRDSQQFGDLRLPRRAGTAPAPVVVVIHGGCWTADLASLQNTAALADALRNEGAATWNVEYRRLGNRGGGWPGTFLDVAAAVDHLRVLAKSYPLDLHRVVIVGHSAGAQLALWAAARSRIAPTSDVFVHNALKLQAVVALGGPGDLQDFKQHGEAICGQGVVVQLLGGPSERVPERYAVASPIALLPFAVKQLLIVADHDPIMSPASAAAYVAAAQRAGDSAEVLALTNAGHFELIAPHVPAGRVVVLQVLELARAAGALDAKRYQ